MRVTLKQLEAKAAYINKLLNAPERYFDKVGEVPYKSNIGHYFIGQQYAGVSLEMVSNESGGVRTIFHTTTKRELLAQMSAFISGFEHKEQVS